jgi:hypothetical protein
VISSLAYLNLLGTKRLGCCCIFEPLVVLPTEPLSFTSLPFHTNSNKEVLQTKPHDPFLLLEDHYFAVTLLHQNTYAIHFEDLSQEMLDFSSLLYISVK